MKSRSFPLSQKYIDFINTTNGIDAEFLEGTTASGKTTVGAGVKFMRMVSASKKKLHIIASKSTGTAEKNIINQDNGILDLHRTAKYYGNGDKDYKIPHIKFEGKIIFVLGYDHKERWQLVLGSQFGCVYIDEMNTANIEFLREISTRNEYMLGTLNPDSPDLPVYKEFVNRSRPFKKYAKDVPDEITKELKERENPRWKYWFFTFNDNLSLTEEDIQRKKNSAPIGTKLYKNKILGLRGKATGLVFPEFGSRHIMTAIELRNLMKAGKVRFKKFVGGLDTSYSQKSKDTVAMIFIGITEDRKLFVLEENVMSNKGRDVPFAPSDIALEYIQFMGRCEKAWGFARENYIDSADQATITELRKYKRLHGSLLQFIDSYKKVTIIDRINLMNGWIHQDCYIVLANCTEHIAELEKYSWEEDKDAPEDGNDHTINACQYAWIPHRDSIGFPTD